MVVEDRKGLTVFLGGHAFPVALPDTLSADEEAGGADDQLVAPMPGLVKVLNARAGEAVTKDQPLVILEAMKMEHTLTAPFDGIVEGLTAEADKSVAEGVLLMQIVADETGD